MTLSAFSKKLKNRYQKGCQESIVSAGRWPPHPWGKPANRDLMVWRFWKRRKRQTSQKVRQYGPRKLQKSIKMGPQIDAKSMKSRGCVADAFLERFGCIFGANRPERVVRFGTPLATIFDQKSEKWVQKRFQKSMPKKGRNLMPKLTKKGAKMGSKIDEKLIEFWKWLESQGMCRHVKDRVLEGDGWKPRQPWDY